MLFYVALMLLFLVFPTALMIVFFFYALSPESRTQILPRTAGFGPDRLSIEYFRPSEDKTDNEAPEEAAPVVYSSESFAYDTIKSVSDSGKYLQIRMKRSPYLIRRIPLSAFVSADDAEIVRKMLADKFN